MNRLVWTVTLIPLLVAPGPAMAQIDLSWDNCIQGAPGEPAPEADKVFDCATPRIYKLHATFMSPVDIPTFNEMEFYLDFYSMREHVPPQYR